MGETCLQKDIYSTQHVMHHDCRFMQLVVILGFPQYTTNCTDVLLHTQCIIGVAYHQDCILPQLGKGMCIETGLQDCEHTCVTPKGHAPT